MFVLLVALVLVVGSSLLIIIGEKESMAALTVSLRGN